MTRVAFRMVEQDGVQIPRPTGYSRMFEAPRDVLHILAHQELTRIGITSNAVRDGAPPIELVDGNDLVDLFESLEFGLIPKQAYDVDESFFLQFDA